ncbi:MAG: ComEC/Rec2 family competence protein [Chloroflexi bacterium]|nr:ComEC/Rec2 family competence protein [Chloroflexota bacterium]
MAVVREVAQAPNLKHQRELGDTAAHARVAVASDATVAARRSHERVGAVLARAGVAAALGVAAGIGLAGSVAQPPWWLAAGGVVALVAWRLTYGGIRAWLILGAIVCAAAQLGAWRMTSELSQQASATGQLQSLAGTQEVRGLVADDPTPKARTTSLTLDHVLVKRGADWQPLDAHVIVSVPLTDEHEYGEYLQLTGRLQPLDGDSGATLALERQGVLASMAYPRVAFLANPQANPILQTLFGVRKRLGKTIAATLPDPAASTLQATILGIRSALPKDEQQALVSTGTVHLVVISGFKLSLLAAGLEALALWVLRRTGGRLRTRAAVAGAVVLAIAGYTLLTGATPSASRAAIMAGLAVLAGLAGRPRDQLTGLAVAVVAILAAHPQDLFDAGFELSCLSVLGIILLGQPLAARLRGSRPAQAIAAEAFATSVAATAFDLPVLAGSFHIVSAISPITNLVGMPLLGPIMGFGGIGAALGTIWQPLGAVLLWPAWALSTVLDAIVHIGAAAPFATIPIADLPAWAAAVYWALLLAVTWAVRSTAGLSALAITRPRPPAWLAAVAVGAAVGLTAAIAFLGTLPPSTLRVTFLDVPGEAALIQTPSGARVLVDGGESAPDLERRLGELLPPWDRRLDVVVATSPRQDHIGALPDALTRYEVRALVAPEAPNPSVTYRKLQPTAPAVPIDLGRGALLSPEADGWRLTASGRSILFDGTTAADLTVSATPPTGGLWVRPAFRTASPEPAQADAIDLAQTGTLAIEL